MKNLTRKWISVQVQRTCVSFFFINMPLTQYRNILSQNNWHCMHIVSTVVMCDSGDESGRDGSYEGDLRRVDVCCVVCYYTDTAWEEKRWGEENSEGMSGEVRRKEGSRRQGKRWVQRKRDEMRWEKRREDRRNGERRIKDICAQQRECGGER